MIVVDASAMVDLLLSTQKGKQVARRLSGEILHAPAILDLEVVQTLRRWERTAQLDSAGGAAAIEDLLNLPMILHAHDTLLRRIWALHHNFTAYDAAYLALAAALGCPVLTSDRRLAPARQHGIQVELI